MREHLAALQFRGRNMLCLDQYLNATERKVHGKKKRQLQYHVIESDESDSGFAADGQSFMIEWNIPEQWQLTVTGRNLRPIYDRISEHRIRRLRVADRDFAPDTDKQPVITKIELVPVEE